MATPTQHAMLSASSAHRWLACTAAPKFEAQFEDGTSIYAQEGTLAHSICEIYAAREFNSKDMTTRKFNARLKKLQAEELYQDEMLECAAGYVEYLKEKAIGLYQYPPHVTQEVKVDFSEYVPEGFGTCDCVMIGGDTIHITDYKHGKGVKVEAEDNPQMRLYALGALKFYEAFYGSNIKWVSMGIYQPRISTDASEDRLSVEELKAWATNYVAPRAMAAYTGNGAAYASGPHCKFCKGKAVCKARAENNTALEDFMGFAIPDASAPAPSENCLTLAQISDLLKRGQNLVDWYGDLQEFAREALLNGQEIEGWKVVEGKSNRTIANADALVEALKAAGYDEALLFERKLLTLTNLEKLTGKKAFAEISEGLIVKPKGKPTLAPATDKRPVYADASTDFAEATNG